MADTLPLVAAVVIGKSGGIYEELGLTTDDDGEMFDVNCTESIPFDFTGLDERLEIL